MQLSSKNSSNDDVGTVADTSLAQAAQGLLSNSTGATTALTNLTSTLLPVATGSDEREDNLSLGLPLIALTCLATSVYRTVLDKFIKPVRNATDATLFRVAPLRSATVAQNKTCNVVLCCA
jgi:hypothetical protein